MFRHFSLSVLVAGLVACSATPLGPEPPHRTKVYRVLMVTPGNPELAATLVEAAEVGLAASAEKIRVELDVLKVHDLPSVSRELKSMQIKPGHYNALFVDSITWARAAQLLLPHTPVVFDGVSDPVGRCVVDSLRKPGRNATGYMHYLYSDSTKRMEMLKLAFPERREVLLLVDHNNILSPGCDESSTYWTEQQQEACSPGPRAPDAYLNRRMNADDLQQHARSLGMKATFVVMCELEDLAMLARWAKGRPQAAWQVPWHDRFDANRERLIGHLNDSNLPAIFPHPGFTKVGGLMSFAAIEDTHLDQPSVQSLVQVLLGEPPATLPVQVPRGFSFTINAQAAQRLGLRPSLHALRVADTILH